MIACLFILFQSMNESLKVPHMNIGDEYDVTRLSSLRRDLNRELESQGVRVSLTAFLIKAMSIAMDEYPIVNSKFNTTTQNSVRYVFTINKFMLLNVNCK